MSLATQLELGFTRAAQEVKLKAAKAANETITGNWLMAQMGVKVLPELAIPAVGYIGFAAKSDGLYQKIGTAAEQRLLVGADLSPFPSKLGVETISGQWNFSVNPTVQGYGVWHSGNFTPTAIPAQTADTLVGNLHADLLDGRHGSYYLTTQSLRGDNVDYNTVTWDTFNKGIIISEVNPANYTGQTNTPFGGDYGQMVTFGGVAEALFPFQLGVNNNNSIFAFRGAGYKDTTNRAISNPWRYIWHSGNLPNPVSGTGTGNVIPKWAANGTSLIGSLISDDGVGLVIEKTNDPSDRLDHFTPVTFKRADGYGKVEIRANSNMGQTYGTWLSLHTTDSANLLNEALRITSSGNVGIGTTGPKSKLDVNGTIAVRQQGTGTIASPVETIALVGVNSNGDVGIPPPSINFVNTWRSTHDSWMNFHVRNNTVDTTAMTLLYNGNVGIGTTTPNGKLDVQSTVAWNTPVISQYWSTQNADYNLRLETLYDAYGINYNFIQKDNGVDKNVLSFKNGNVGIGTTGPASQLHVGGNVSSQISIGTVDFGGNGGQAIGAIQANEDVVNGWGNLYFQTNGWNSYPAGTYTPSTKMAILGNGNVGIGTTAPTALLHIEHPASETQLKVVGGGASGQRYTGPWVNLVRKGIYDEFGLRYYTEGALNWFVGVPYQGGSGESYKKLIIGTSGTAETGTVATFTSEGNVGIGTTAPGYTLDVAGDISVITNEGKIYFSPDKYLYEDQSDGEAIKLRLHTAQGTQAFIIEDQYANKKFAFSVIGNSWLNGGNVGIGYSTGAEITNNTLAVNGSIHGTVFRQTYDNTATTSCGVSIPNWSLSFPVPNNSGGNAIAALSGFGGVRIYTGAAERVSIDNSGKSVFSSSVTASSFIKSGGTTSQFLKANGDVDSTVYAVGTLTGSGNRVLVTDNTNTVQAFPVPAAGNRYLSFNGTTLSWSSITSFVNTIMIGAANGVASLDANGKVPESQLAGYVSATDSRINGWTWAAGLTHQHSNFTVIDSITQANVTAWNLFTQGEWATTAWSTSSFLSKTDSRIGVWDAMAAATYATQNWVDVYYALKHSHPYLSNSDSRIAVWDGVAAWGNHTLAGYVTGTPWTSAGYSTQNWVDVNYALKGHNHSGVYEPAITGNNNAAYYWSGAKTWVAVPSGGGAHLLSAHTDVSYSGLATGDILAYNGGTWVAPHFGSYIVIVSTGTGQLASSTITFTELSALSGISGTAIQTQLNNKANLSGSTSQAFNVSTLYAASTINCSNVILNSSDIRLKHMINNLTDAAWTDRINFVDYRFKNDSTSRKHYGVLAQELECIAPELVHENPDGMKSVAYIDLLIAKIARLEQRLKIVENGS